ncbi:helix-turn-helix domain-containing protein [Desulfitobacterium hafniense]|uniref:helix-turn-helix domain-containing protein n=1 Tax=Desulfitobacterium hafniense TaxID=49338 RepID=UPI0003036757|nr:helix-turn-helix transcriptional regulator [Desulfitobacterium hafniense]
MGVGKNIEKIRRERGFTRKELAERSGISDDYLQKIEAETINRVHLKTLVRIASVLDTGIDELKKNFDEIS